MDRFTRPPRWVNVALLVGIVAIWACRLAWAKCDPNEEQADATIASVTYDGVEQPLDAYQAYTHMLEASFESVTLWIRSEADEHGIETYDWCCQQP